MPQPGVSSGGTLALQGICGCVWGPLWSQQGVSLAAVSTVPCKGLHARGPLQASDGSSVPSTDGTPAADKTRDARSDLNFRAKSAHL